jgi:hypothetical protein
MALEAAGAKRGLKRLRVPVFAIVNNETALHGDKGGVAHVVGVAEPGFPTIDQLKVLLTVVETGSFTAAAKRLNRAVSAISYTVASLEQQLGIELFDREGTRTPTLTKAGAAVVSKARAVWPSASMICGQAFGPCSAASRLKSPWWST